MLNLIQIWYLCRRSCQIQRPLATCQTTIRQSMFRGKHNVTFRVNFTMGLVFEITKD